MKTFLQKFLLVSSLAIFATHAHAIDSSYIGAEDARWSRASNWSPARVPDNHGHRTFDVTIDNRSATLDIDVTISSFTILGDSLVGLTSIDSNLSSAVTSLAAPTGIDLRAKNRDVVMDAGQLANFSGTTLTGGSYVIQAFEGHSATLRFAGADIRTLDAFIWLIGGESQVVNESNQDALTQLGHVLLDGYMALQSHDFSTGSLVNEGYVFHDKSNWTIEGDFTSIGDRRNPGTLGYLFGLARQGEDARIVVTGELTNYDSASQTLNSGRFYQTAVGPAANTLQVLGGDLLDIVDNNGSIVLYGPNTGLLDKNGDDALRHLAVINRNLQVGSRSFTTAGDLLVNDSLVIYGDSDFIVSGTLTNNGYLLFSPANAYNVSYPGYPGVPSDKIALNTKLNVQGDLVFGPENTLELDIYGRSAKGVITVTGQAVLDGTMIVTVPAGATVTADDRFVVLVTAELSGSFTNVPSGQRIDAHDLDGAPAGSFLVTYKGKRLVLSDYLPATSNSSASTPSQPRRRTSFRD